MSLGNLQPQLLYLEHAGNKYITEQRGWGESAHCVQTDGHVTFRETKSKHQVNPASQGPRRPGESIKTDMATRQQLTS